MPLNKKPNQTIKNEKFQESMDKIYQTWLTKFWLENPWFLVPGYRVHLNNIHEQLPLKSDRLAILYRWESGWRV